MSDDGVLQPGDDRGRLALAAAFLQEAVYRSRGDQAGAALMTAGRSASGAAPSGAGPSGTGPSGAAPCGLGEKPSVVLDLSPRAEELFGVLFGTGRVDLDAIHACMGEWVKRQDGLDRKRNHFLKDFRGAHGMDRRTYSEAVGAEYESGLGAVNAKVAAERDAAAARLLERAQTG